MPVTPNLGLNTPVIGSNNWGGPLNYNFSQLDSYLSGVLGLPGLLVSGDVTVTGSVTAGSFVGIDGTFLTSALFDQPNGIPQLNGAGLIPAFLLPSQAIVGVTYSATPVFDATQGGSFKIILSGNVSSSTYANGTAGSSIVAFRIVQDGTGGRTFAWPANVRGGGAINPGANARSVQVFSLDTDGSLDALGPMQYS